MRKPYPTHACVDSLTKFLAKFNPKVASVTVKDVVDSSLVAELDKSAFIDSVYREMVSGKITFKNVAPDSCAATSLKKCA